MSNGTSTIVAVFSIIASMAALAGLQATLFGRVIDSFRERDHGAARQRDRTRRTRSSFESRIDRSRARDSIRAREARVTELGAVC